MRRWRCRRPKPLPSRTIQGVALGWVWDAPLARSATKAPKGRPYVCPGQRPGLRYGMRRWRGRRPKPVPPRRCPGLDLGCVVGAVGGLIPHHPGRCPGLGLGCAVGAVADQSPKGAALCLPREPWAWVGMRRWRGRQPKPRRGGPMITQGNALGLGTRTNKNHQPQRGGRIPPPEAGSSMQ